MLKLYAVVMLNYRRPLGDKAWRHLDIVLGKGVVNQFAFLCGLLSAGGMTKVRFERFIQDELKELQ